jgi:hypothetical protein
MKNILCTGPPAAMNTYAPSLARQGIAIHSHKRIAERIDWEKKPILRTNLVAMGA